MLLPAYGGCLSQSCACGAEKSFPGKDAPALPNNQGKQKLPDCRASLFDFGIRWTDSILRKIAQRTGAKP